LRRLAQGGAREGALSEVDGRAWFLYDGTLSRLVDGVLEPQLEDVMDVGRAVRDSEGRVWITSRQPVGSYWRTRVARVGVASTEIVREAPGSDLDIFDAGSERDFIQAPWGFSVRDGALLLCPFSAPTECIALPDLEHRPVITASHRLFAWRAGVDATTLLSRRAR
jgi:hypothetical protein